VSNNQELDVFGSLATAVGLTDSTGFRGEWFNNPVGGTGNAKGLKHILSSDEQREALLEFVDQVLGAPDRQTENGATWVPLFSEQGATIYAVVTPSAGKTVIGFGVEYKNDGATKVIAKVHVPIFQIAGTSDTRQKTPEPDWLFLGKDNAFIEISLGLDFADVSPASGEVALDGVTLKASIPTNGSDAFGLSLTLEQFQLPGSSTPQDFELNSSSLATLGPDILEFVLSLLKAQADAIDDDSAFAPFKALMGLLGLTNDPNIPELPIENFVTQGVSAVVVWLESIFISPSNRNAWFNKLAQLLGVTPTDIMSVGNSTKLNFTLTLAKFGIGLKIGSTSGGGIQITPFIDVTLAVQSNIQAKFFAEILTADTAKGEVKAFPTLSAMVEFGTDNPTSSSDPNILMPVDSSFSPAIGINAIKLGARLLNGKPEFALTAHGVTMGSDVHALMDLSSPNSALDALSTAVNSALSAALSALGRPGEITSMLIGLNPPTGISGISAQAIVNNPLNAVRDYWNALRADSNAMRSVLLALQELFTGNDSDAVTGSGSDIDPWRVDFNGIQLLVRSIGDELLFDFGAEFSTPIFDDFAASATIHARLLRCNLVQTSAEFFNSFSACVEFKKADDSTARFDLGPADLLLKSFGVEAAWSPRDGFAFYLKSSELALEIDAISDEGGTANFEIPLPKFKKDGSVDFTPDWEQLESIVAILLSRINSPIIEVMLDLSGWRGLGAHLKLEGLVSDPKAALLEWLGELVIDCANIRTALQPVAYILNGFRDAEPSGYGHQRAPYRCAIAAEPSAPAVVAWFDPGCPLALNRYQTLPGRFDVYDNFETQVLVDALHDASSALPDLADLLTGRNQLAEGFSVLIERFAGTDGIVGRPVSLPENVDGVSIQGFGYSALIARGATKQILADIFPSKPNAVLFVGCEDVWASCFGAEVNSFDLRTASTRTPISSSANDIWSLALPTPTQAAIARPDLGGIAEQAQRINRLLQGRSAPITVVAYGAAGAAAIKAAQTNAQIEHVATVGAPWGAVSVDTFSTGLSGDALRFLSRIPIEEEADPDQEWYANEAVEYLHLFHLIDRALASVGDSETLFDTIPDASALALRSGLKVTAAFGNLSSQQLNSALAELVREAINYAYADLDSESAIEQEKLYLGLDIPVNNLNLGGILVGAGATLELVSFDRGTGGDSFAIHNQQQLHLRLNFGVHDGWLIGGPGSDSPIEARWMSVDVKIPINDPTRSGSTEIIFHEANCVGVKRDRWIVSLDALAIGATVVDPASHMIMADIVSRIGSVSPEFTSLFACLGLVRDGGFDAQGIDRLVFDTEQTLRAALSAKASDMAGILRSLYGFSGNGTSLAWSIDAATISVDLATRTLGVDILHESTGFPPFGLSVALSQTGLRMSGAVGFVDTTRGGIQLRGVIESATPSDAELYVDWKLPGQSPVDSIDVFDPAHTDRLSKLVASFVPATLISTVIDVLRGRVQASSAQAIDQVLQSLQLLKDADEFGYRGIYTPWALFMDPGAWLRFGAAPWQSDPFGQTIAVMDKLLPIIVPGHSGTGWPLSDDVAITYSVISGQLRLGLAVNIHHNLGDIPLDASIIGGIAISQSGNALTVLPAANASVQFNGNGLAVAITPDVRVDILRPLTSPLQIYPNSPGVGALIGAGLQMALPPVLNALAAQRSNASVDQILRDTGQVVFDLGGALDLLEAGQFSSARITNFANNPAAAFLDRIPQLTTATLTRLAQMLNSPSLAVAVSSPAPGKTKLDFGSPSVFSMTMDNTVPSTPAVVLSAQFQFPQAGTIRVNQIRLNQYGMQAEIRYIGENFNIGNAVMLRPVIHCRAGITAGSFSRLFGIGLELDSTGQCIEFRWNLDASPPYLAIVDSEGVETASSDTDLAIAITAKLLSLASSFVFQKVALVENSEWHTRLKGVVLLDQNGLPALDTALFSEFVNIEDPQPLLNRIYRLAFNLAGPDIKLSFGDSNEVVVSLIKKTDGPNQSVGINVNLNGNLNVATGDPNVDLEVLADWIKSSVASQPGFSLYLIKKDASDHYSLAPSFALAGLGVRVSKTAGPLIDLGIMSINALAVHVYGEHTGSDFGAGVHLQLDGLALTPSSGGGNNAVAENLLSDAASSSSPSARPSFSPSIAIQKNPGPGDAKFSLRAGEGNGPWWLVIQRQLGPVYIEQFGLKVDEDEQNINAITMLFDARVDMFGMSAAVDQLSLTWHRGGDFFDVSSWSADLAGFAVAGDFSGLSLSGGMLKTNDDGVISYVGMLTGRFATYGLSVFGGYTANIMPPDPSNPSPPKPSPSFFVFGAIVGPIGGPPAFFLTGLGGGLGIQRKIRMPDDFSQFATYPFIEALDPNASSAGDPMEKLRRLNTYFGAEPGNFWFAAGISFTCFSLVDGIAVLSVSFGKGLDINLLGLARMALPRPQAPLVSIELGLIARFSTSEGLFLIQAQLTDNSWLLYPEVRLTGGFAFATWWKGKNAGQFVMTLGGYHPSFSREGYPIVPRLGLVWKLGDAIVIKGGTYFALTSEALMAGLDIEVSVDFGFVWARISFGAHAIIYFDPFYLIANAYARISAGIKIDTFFGTISLSFSLGASIEVEGPDFHGKARLELGPVDVTVPFGNQNTAKHPTISWDEFVAKYLERGVHGGARSVTGITGKGSLPAATDGKRDAPSSDGSEDRPYEVFAEFELSIVSTIPIKKTQIHFVGVHDMTIKTSDGTATTINLAPVGTSNFISVFELALYKKDNAGNWPNIDSLHSNSSSKLAKLAAGFAQESESHKGASYGYEAFPIGAWGESKDPEQPSKALPKGDVIFAPNRYKLVAEADPQNITGPPINNNRVEAERRHLPLLATGPMRATIINSANSFGLPSIPSQTEALMNLAQQTLFSDLGPIAVDGFIGNSQRSATAKASYVGSRTAPPMFGTLTEGMLEANDVNASSALMQAAPAVVGRTPRAPFVATVMTSGTGVELRPKGTSVSNQRIKRRAAPSIDSVKGRLGRSLPISMKFTAAPAFVNDLTVITQGAIPKTHMAGVARSYRGGHVGTAFGGSIVSGLSSPLSNRAKTHRHQPQGFEPGSRLRPGDVVVLNSPDAAIDVHENRPSLRVDGTARVVVLDSSGFAQQDVVVSNDKLDICKGAALIAIQADGTVDDIVENHGINIIGWHDQSRVARLGQRSALGAACVINTQGQGIREPLGWNTAGDIVRNAAVVSTRFDHQVKTIGLVLRQTQLKNLLDTDVDIINATSNHTLDQPTVIQIGGRSIVLFEVQAKDQSPIIIRVNEGGTRQIAGVIASQSAMNDVADLIADRGLLSCVARLRAAKGSGCTLHWQQAEISSSQPTPGQVSIQKDEVVFSGNIAAPNVFKDTNVTSDEEETTE